MAVFPPGGGLWIVVRRDKNLEPVRRMVLKILLPRSTDFDQSFRTLCWCNQTPAAAKKITSVRNV